MRKQKSDLDFETSTRARNLPDPVLSGDAANKQWVESLITAAIEGLKNKDPVRVRTTANVNLAAPGASLDGVAMNAGERFLAGAQTTGTEVGIYIWNGAATAATRAPDANTWTELVNAIVPVAEGTDAGKLFRQTVATGVLGTTTPVFSSFGTTAGAATEAAAGILEIATQAETDTGTDDQRALTPLKAKTASWAVRKKTFTFGDASATQYDLTHSLNTLDVLVQVRLASTDENVDCDVRRSDANTVRVNVAAAPGVNALKAVVLG